MQEAEAAKAQADKEKKEKEAQEAAAAAAAAAAAGTAEHAASGDNDAASSTLRPEEEPEHVPQEETVSRAGFIKPVVSYCQLAYSGSRF